ncbi:MAG: ABC transporter substrate-binding protein [Desulfobacterales bacterium]|nr:ABC transporter substrate-binding protein [Desulfobacterales bacterium]
MRDSLNRRDFLKTVAATGVGAMGVPLKTRRAYGEDTDRVKIGYLPITDATPLLIAHAKGYYEEEGLKADKPVKIRDWSSLSESFLTKKFNLVHLLLPIPIGMRYNINFPVKVLAWDHTNGSAITVRSDSNITDFSELGGKQIAVPYWYSMHNVILQLGLREVGLKPVIRPQSVILKPDEVNLFVLPPPEMPVALTGKKIDGYIVAEPFNAIAEMKIGAKIMRFTGDMWRNHPCCVVVMDERVVSSNPIFTQKVMNAVVRAQLWTLNNLGEAAKILCRDGENKYLPASEKALLRVFTGYDTGTYGKGAVPQAIRHPEWNVGRIGFQPYPYPSATRFMVSQMKQTLIEGDITFLKNLEPDFIAKDLVDDTFVKKAIDSVGGPGKFDSVNPEHPWTRKEIIKI